MDHFRGLSLPQSTRCLAINKIKARMIKNSMIRDKMNKQSDDIACKVIKYQTFLSQKVLNHINTEQLQDFQQEMKQFCSNKKSFESSRSQASERPLGICQFMNQVKKQAKIKLQKIKERSKTQQNLQDNLFLYAQKSHVVRKQLNPFKSYTNKIKQKYMNDGIRNKKIIQKRFSLKGKQMNSNLVNIIQKIQQMGYYSNSLNPKFIEIRQQHGIGSTQQLKKQQQRLCSANETQERHKFQPIGRVSDDKKNIKLYHSEQKLISNHSPKMHSKRFKKNSISSNLDPISKDLKQTHKLQASTENRTKRKNKSLHNVASKFDKAIPIKGFNHQIDQSYI